MRPYPYQLRSVEFLQSRNRSILAHEPGLGKSAISLLAADVPAIVVCPASLLVNWRREIDAWRPLDCDQFEVVTYGDRRLKEVVSTTETPWRTLIVDEAHFIKNAGTQRTRRVCKLIRRVGRAGKVFALTGTPVPNRPIELWPLLYSMGVTDMRYEEFAYRYADAFVNQWGQLDVTGACNLRELRQLLEPVTIRFTKEQVMPDLPDKTWRVVALDLPLEQREKRLDLSEIDRMPFHVAFEAYSDVLHLHGQRKVPLALEHVTSILEAGEKVIVLCHHRDVVQMMSEGLASWGAVAVDGSVPRAHRQVLADQFQEDPETRAFVGQVQTVGVGMNLTAASHVVFVEASWVPGVLEQGQTGPTGSVRGATSRSISSRSIARSTSTSSGGCSTSRRSSTP